MQHNNKGFLLIMVTGIIGITCKILYIFGLLSYNSSALRGLEHFQIICEQICPVLREPVWFVRYQQCDQWHGNDDWTGVGLRV